MRRRTLAPDHWLLARAKTILGECLAHLGQAETAKLLLVEGYQGLSAKLGESREQTRMAREKLERISREQSNLATKGHEKDTKEE